MKISDAKKKIRATLRRLKDRIPPFACGHAMALLGHCLHNDALAIAAELILVTLYVVRKH